MPARRWAGALGAVLALTGGVGIVGGGGDPRFDGEVAVSSSLPGQIELDQLMDGLQRPEVRDQVRARLGYVPPVRVTAGDEGVLVVRSRAGTPARAAQAAVTYATAYADLRRREAHRDLMAAADAVEVKLDQLRAQLAQADDVRRGPLLEQQAMFVQRLDDLQRQPDPIADVVGARTMTVAALPWLWLLAGGVLLLAADSVRTACRRRWPAGPAPAATE